MISWDDLWMIFLGRSMDDFLGRSMEDFLGRSLDE